MEEKCFHVLKYKPFRFLPSLNISHVIYLLCQAFKIFFIVLFFTFRKQSPCVLYFKLNEAKFFDVFSLIFILELVWSQLIMILLKYEYENDEKYMAFCVASK